MDVEKHSIDQRAYQTSRASGLLAGALTAFIAFCTFQIFGFTIGETATWMFALGLMAASGTFATVYFVGRSALRRPMPAT
ncbi:hypothetical protein SAMN04489752_3009 [Brevibacterium siliguriense]|uniref:Uncharacterized protein n=1 Tax=Brevibacterium siliguriense TaxID=1136497 RepID=A0A1H1WKK3_9MICO|nr:hypothetical protein [Brevibacterium siliguriense]SDS97564.1 hypothetical protein SAMN04489752_3009 [Brevibacterium siliguriense]